MNKCLFCGLLVCFGITFQAAAQRKSFTQSFDKGIVVLDAYTSVARIESRSSESLSYKMPVFLSARNKGHISLTKWSAIGLILSLIM